MLVSAHLLSCFSKRALDLFWLPPCWPPASSGAHSLLPVPRPPAPPHCSSALLSQLTLARCPSTRSCEKWNSHHMLISSKLLFSTLPFSGKTHGPGRRLTVAHAEQVPHGSIPSRRLVQPHPWRRLSLCLSILPTLALLPLVQPMPATGAVTCVPHWANLGCGERGNSITQGSAAHAATNDMHARNAQTPTGACWEGSSL